MFEVEVTYVLTLGPLSLPGALSIWRHSAVKIQKSIKNNFTQIECVKPTAEIMD